jgi:hypothetical protein
LASPGCSRDLLLVLNESILLRTCAHPFEMSTSSTSFGAADRFYEREWKEITRYEIGQKLQNDRCILRSAECIRAVARLEHEFTPATCTELQNVQQTKIRLHPCTSLLCSKMLRINEV